MIERGRKLEEGVKLGREPVLGAQPQQEAGLEEGWAASHWVVGLGLLGVSLTAAPLTPPACTCHPRGLASQSQPGFWNRVTDSSALIK